MTNSTRTRRSLVALAWMLGVLVAPAAAEDKAAQPAPGLVVSVSEPATDAGLATLRRGGSAVDAAVATAFALAVTWPSAGNLGGGGFMMILPGPGQKPVCVEYRETAPGAATPRTLADYPRLDGHLVCGTPGTVAGLALAHGRYGTLPWRDVVMPAARLAREGFVVDRALAGSLNRVLRKSPKFAELQRVFAPPPGKKKWQPGDRLVQPDLARTLATIATAGPAAFYQGPIAEQIVAEMRAGGGLVSKADLAGYQARLREPIHGTYRGYDVFGPPPPSSGGICLVEMLNILETFRLGADEAGAGGPGAIQAGSPRRWSARDAHLVIEAMRRAFCDRARYLGDPDFVRIPAHLTDKQYARKLAAQIHLERATPSETLAPDVPMAPEPPATTHFSVVDGNGMAVANTYTLENSYGCRVVVRGAGFLLNNEMTDFNRIPGRTDRKGLIGTPPNQIAPGKRMLSSQTPTLVLRDGRLVLVTGSPGGRTIINTVLCTLVNLVDYRMSPREALDAPRLHHAWLPDKVHFEALKDPGYAATVARLRQMGHAFDPRSGKQGDAHTIAINPTTGRPVGLADWRITGKR